MALRNTQLTYGALAKFFHWLIFILVAGLVIVGFTAEEFAQPLKISLIGWHKIIGLLVLLFTLARLGWTLINPKPRLPDGAAVWERGAVFTVHSLLYLALFVMTISGWIMSTAAGKAPRLFGQSLPFPGIPVDKAISALGWDIHSTAIWVLIGLVALHILAALKHHFIDKDNILRRMWLRQ
jgi:cytochrome b561